MTDYEIDNVKTGANKNIPSSKRKREKKIIHDYKDIKDYHIAQEHYQSLELRKALKDLGADG